MTQAITREQAEQQLNVLHQLANEWQKIAAMLLMKLAKPGETIEFGVADIEALGKMFPDEGGAVVFTHGMGELGFSLRLISQKQAQLLIALHNLKMPTAQ
jgi:hypothetical protein